jgi:quinol monooxygenase YgiN
LDCELFAHGLQYSLRPINQRRKVRDTEREIRYNSPPFFRLHVWYAHVFTKKVNEMVLNTSSVTIYPEKRAEFFQTMTQLLEPLNGTAGCKAFRLYVDVADENSSLIMSEWDSETDLNNYLNSADHAILHGAITVLSKRSTELKAVVN